MTQLKKFLEFRVHYANIRNSRSLITNDQLIYIRDYASRFLIGNHNFRTRLEYPSEGMRERERVLNHHLGGRASSLQPPSITLLPGRCRALLIVARLTFYHTLVRHLSHLLLSLIAILSPPANLVVEG